jgi:hypothetical protein
MIGCCIYVLAQFVRKPGPLARRLGRAEQM